MSKFLLISILFIAVACTPKNNKQSKQPTKQISSSELTKPKTTKKTESKTLPESIEMIYFKGGSFLMGSNSGLPQESPVHKVTVKPFKIDKTPVTVAQFRIFVNSTNYKTEAERFGDSGVFNLEEQRWTLLPGAYWEKPFGPDGPDAKDNHPVTHVTWNDAVQFASWAGKRLPTEAEWEYAARSGKNTKNKFSWGNKVSVNGKYFANTWQGKITAPEVKDGYLYTSPVGAFGENEAGLTDMGGNVWQWCADTYKAYPGSNAAIREDPNVKVIRSGSFFFDQNGENSFSVSARSMNSHETSLFNTGFRCAVDGE